MTGLRVKGEALLDIAKYLDAAPGKARQAARYAINDTIRTTGMDAIKAEMQRQIAFPRGYLDDPNRLSVTQFATETQLEARITGRHSPTSLARFAIGGSPGARGGVEIGVKAGGSTRLAKRAFLIRLKRGTEFDDSTFNLGLAVRLRPGETLANKRVQARQLGTGGNSSVYLLYGPSIDQVMRDAAAKVAPEIADKAMGEFYRQFARLMGED
jgi:hypothetical protein